MMLCSIYVLKLSIVSIAQYPNLCAKVLSYLHNSKNIVQYFWVIKYIFEFSCGLDKGGGIKVKG